MVPENGDLRWPGYFTTASWPGARALTSFRHSRMGTSGAGGGALGPRPLIIINHVTLAPGEDARVPLGPAGDAHYDRPVPRGNRPVSPGPGQWEPHNSLPGFRAWLSTVIEGCLYAAHARAADTL